MVEWLLEYVHCRPKLSMVCFEVCVLLCCYGDQVVMETKLLWRPGCYGDQVVMETKCLFLTNGSRLCSTVTHCCFHIRFEERRRELGRRIKEREKKERKRGGEERGVRVEG